MVRNGRRGRSSSQIESDHLIHLRSCTLPRLVWPNITGLNSARLRKYSQSGIGSGLIYWCNRNQSFQSDKLVRYRVVLVDVSRLKLMERQALETGDRLRLLASELALSEEHTRKAIAQTLHDEVGQTLAVANMKSSTVLTLPNNKAAEKIVQELHDMLALAIKQTRALMTEISPPFLRDLKLEAAIDWMAERMSSEHGIDVKMVKTGDFSELEQDLAIMLYQMTRELLANSVKHSGGRQVLVTVERESTLSASRSETTGKGSMPRGRVHPQPKMVSGSSQV